MGVVKEKMLEAGAGAGKTTSLVKMILENVKSKEAELNEIIAITFTEAATNELKERFQKKYIEEYIELEKKTNRTKEEEKVYYVLKNSIDKLDSIGISTIHGFCNKLLNESPFDLGYGIDRNVVTDQEEEIFIQSLYYRAVEELRDKLNDLSMLGLNIKDLYSTFKSMFKKRNVDWSVDESVVSNKKITDVIKCCTDIYNNIYIFICNFLSNFKKEEKNFILKEPAEKFINSGKLNGDATYQDIGVLKKILKDNTKSGDSGLDVFFSSKKNATDDVKALLNKAKTIYADNINEIILLANEAMSQTKEFDDIVRIISGQFLKEVYKKAWELKKESNIITNDDILYDAEVLLKKINNGEIKKELNYKFCYIDEFQDTDPCQIEIFRTLGEIIQKSPNGNITFYYIGDPKQSIYRFRGADLDCYLNTKKQIEEKLENDNLHYSIDILPKNYRSNQAVLNFVNTFFEKDGFFGNFGYVPMEIGRNNEDDIYKSEINNVLNGVFTYGIKDRSSSAARENDAEYIAALIDTLVTKNVKIFSRGEGIRSIRYSDFLIITPNAKNHRFYVNALNKRGINVNLQGKMEYKDDASNIFYGTILYLTGDKNYAESYILESIYKKEIKNITEEEKQNVEFILRFINEYSNHSPLSFIINFDTLLYDISKHTYYDLDLSVWYQIVEELKENSISTFKDLRNAFENIIKGTLERQLSLSSSANEVRLMNLHKSKGLQGNIVILADPPSKKINKKGHIGEIDGSWYFEIAKNSDAGTQDVTIVDNSKLKEIQQIEQSKNLEEYNRLLYVAATRAKEALLISGYYKITKTKENESEKETLQNSSYWYPLFAFLNDKSENESNNFNILYPDINKELQKIKSQENDNELCNSNPNVASKNRGIEKLFLNYTTEKDIKALQTFKRALIKPSKADEKYLLDSAKDIDGTENKNEDTIIMPDKFIRCNDSDDDGIIELSPTTRGTIIHLMFECVVNFILKSKMKNRELLLSTEKLRNAIIRYSVQSTLIELNMPSIVIAEILSKYQKEFDDILISFLKSNIQSEIDSATAIYTEYPFEYVSKRTDSNEEHTKGIIDLLLVYKGKNDTKIYQVYDYKTNAKNENESIQDYEDRLYNEYKNQFALYEKAIYEIESKEESQSTRCVIRPTKIYHLY